MLAFSAVASGADVMFGAMTHAGARRPRASTAPSTRCARAPPALHGSVQLRQHARTSAGPVSTPTASGRPRAQARRDARSRATTQAGALPVGRLRPRPRAACALRSIQLQPFAHGTAAAPPAPSRLRHVAAAARLRAQAHHGTRCRDRRRERWCATWATSRYIACFERPVLLSALNSRRRTHHRSAGGQRAAVSPILFRAGSRSRTLALVALGDRS